MRQLTVARPVRALNSAARILLSLAFCIGLSGSIEPVTAGGLECHSGGYWFGLE